ncbi:associate of Myc 1 [Artemisia annua]|uniref:Associate of Myc 1 n=1 Tax=Artemisia annua TaxID=35608 RepID=A0A2U1QK48_ARTAN|nr:associate of Myc 1 [Artemisia annua]
MGGSEKLVSTLFHMARQTARFLVILLIYTRWLANMMKASRYLRKLKFQFDILVDCIKVFQREVQTNKRMRKRSTTGKNDAYDNDGFVDEERDIPQQVRDVCVQMIGHPFSLQKVVKCQTFSFTGRVKIISNLKIWHVVGDITKVSTLLPTYFKGVKKVINAVSVIVGQKEGDTPDRTKFSQHCDALDSAWACLGYTYMFYCINLGVYPSTYQTISCHSFGTKMEMCSTVMLLIVLGRAAFVFPLSILSIYMHRSGGESSNISVHHELVIWSAGLMRGVVSIALAFKQLHFSVLLSGSVKKAMELIRWREQPDNYWYYSHRFNLTMLLICNIIVKKECPFKDQCRLLEDEKEAKKEAFRKYLESSGVLDALTKVLVALYEQNDKPSSAVEFVQQKLGGPSLSEYEKLQAEMSDLQIRYNELLALHQEKCSQFVKDSTKPMTTGKSSEDGGNLEEHMVKSDVEKADFTGPVLAANKDLGQKLIDDLDEPLMLEELRNTHTVGPSVENVEGGRSTENL